MLVIGSTGKSPVARSHSCPGFNRPASLAKLRDVSNSSVTITGPGARTTRRVSAVRSDWYGDHYFKKPSDAAPVNAASLARTRLPSTPLPVQSGKTTRFDGLILEAQRACATLDENVAAWLAPSSGDSRDELEWQVHYALHELKRTKKALTNSLLKRWFSPKCRRVAAVLQNKLNSVEVSILDNLAKGKLAEDQCDHVLLGDIIKPLVETKASTGEIRTALAGAMPFDPLATILTREWRAACPGLEALAQKAWQVQESLVEITTLMRDGSGPGIKGYQQERRKKIQLVQQMDVGVPRHLRRFVAKHITPLVVEF